MLRGAPPQDPAKYDGDQNTDPVPIRLIRPVYSARKYRELTPFKLLTSLEYVSPPRRQLPRVPKGLTVRRP